ncbi:hypothetical protein HMPREF0307_01515 [Corynebacterium sp. DNF00584]|nr:hypothetical protein HMPREF0307_01515 [Corynebacterium sp. DNF00584]
MGTAKWMTYYTQELPFIMETQFHATDKRAIAGLSASGAPALTIAEAYPDKYVAVASLSGYTAVSSTMGRIMSLGVTAAKMAPVWEMFGWADDPEWLHYDPILHVDKLKNTKVYFHSGSAWKRRLRHRPTRHVLERRYGVPRTPHQRAFRRPGTWRGCRRHL